MSYDFEVSDEIPAPPEAIFDAWMSSEGHSAMTGSTAVVDPVVGGAYSAWDEYIHGTTQALEYPTRIVQTWRSADFIDEHDDSRIEVLLEDRGDATLVCVRHSNVPDEQRGYENGGWQQSYFDPMKVYFATT